MKVAHLTTVDLSLRYLVLPQLEAAMEFGEVIGISAPGEFVPELEERGIRHIPLPASTRGMNISSDIRAAIQLWRVLRDEGIDILHTHNPKPGVYGRIVGRLAGVPIVVNTVHGLYATKEAPLIKKAVVYGLEWMASRFSDAELIQNPEDFDLLTSRRITPPKRTALLGNGVDLARFNPEAAESHREETRAELGLVDEVAVGMVGRLVAEKGIPELIAAAERLPDGVAIVVAGPDDADKADALPRDLVKRGEAVGIRFLGMRRDVERIYGALDIFVLPSHREGFPRAAMEAAASGLPVIATDIRGCRQVVVHGVTGLLVPVGEVGALTDAIRKISDDADLRRRMGEASAQKAAVEFNEDDVVRIVMSTYRSIAARKGLGWALMVPEESIEIRPAAREDLPAIAELHKRMISSGFLSTLGSGFLSFLYRAMLDSPECRVFVAVSEGDVVGFIAGARDTGRFYRQFIRRHFIEAAWRVLSSLLRRGALRRVYEILRYGDTEPRAAAELLAMAVAPRARRRGVGLGLVRDLLHWAIQSGIGSMKGVVAVDNASATKLYKRSGFVDGRMVEVHRDAPSWEFLWSS